MITESDLELIQSAALSGIDLSDKELINVYPMDDKKHLLIFETQDTPNKIHQIILNSEKI